MDSGKFDVFHDRADHTGFPVGNAVHIKFRGIFKETVDQHRAFFRGLNGVRHVFAQELLVVDDDHCAAAEHERWTHQDGISDFFCDFDRLFDIRCDSAGRLFDIQVIDQLVEFVPVFRRIDISRRSPDDFDAACLKLQRQFQRGLTAELHDDSVAFFAFVDMQDIFQSQRFKIKFVAGVVVRGNRLRIAADHDRFISGFAECEGCVDTAIVELDSLSDPVRASAEDHDFLFAGLSDRFIVSPVGGIVIGSIGFKLSGAGVNEAVNRHQSELFAHLVDFDLVAVEQIRDLAVGIAELLDLSEQRQVFLQVFQRFDRSDFIFKRCELMNVAQEPFVDFRIFVHVFDAPAALECFADMEQAGEIRADQFRAELSVA